MIRLEGVSHSYRKGWGSGPRVLDTGDLCLDHMGITAVVGANGSGKSTLLQLISGLVKPQTGVVRFKDRDVFYDYEDVKSQVHFLSDKAHLYPDLTGEAHVRLLRARVPKWDLEMETNLRNEFLIPMNRPVKSLSRGEQVKLRLLLSLPSKPAIVLIDEMTNDLDTETRKTVYKKLDRYSYEHEARVFIATNIIPDMERYASYVVLLQKGKIVMHSSIDALKERFPKSLEDILALFEKKEAL